jgi:hypothetical protein
VWGAQVSPETGALEGRRFGGHAGRRVEEAGRCGAHSMVEGVGAGALDSVFLQFTPCAFIWSWLVGVVRAGHPVSPSLKLGQPMVLSLAQCF